MCPSKPAPPTLKCWAIIGCPSGTTTLVLRGIRQILPGPQSHRWPGARRRGQPLHSEARNAKNTPECPICGVLPNGPTPTGSVLWLVPISFPRSAPRYLDAAVEQRRREDAKAENNATLAITPKSETFTGQVNPKPPPSLPFASSFFASSRLCCSRPISESRIYGLTPCGV